MNYIFIDASYFIFFRFHALKNWWSLAKKDEPIIPNESQEFKEKFRKIFADKIKVIAKNVGIKKGSPYRIFVGKDCRKSDIWRMSLFGQYKQGRADSTMEGHFFSLVYSEHLFEDICGDNCILEHPKLEADDVIALAVKHIITNDQEAKCYIITSDMDYLQLATTDRVKLYDLKYKMLTEKSKYFKETNSPKKDLFMKYLCGDKSDNIAPVFAKCGKKTAEKLFELSDTELIDFLRSKNAISQYEHNRRMVDFNYIPSGLKDEFMDKYSSRLIYTKL